MTEKPAIVMWPELKWRLDRIDSRHAHVTVFDHGANAGRLTLDRSTWELLARHDQRLIPDAKEGVMTEDRDEVGVVRGEPVVVLGLKPDGWSGLGHLVGDTLVRYPDGEVGAVMRSDIAPLTE